MFFTERIIYKTLERKLFEFKLGSQFTPKNLIVGVFYVCVIRSVLEIRFGLYTKGCCYQAQYSKSLHQFFAFVSKMFFVLAG
jgi:hypothetical protein